MKKRMKKTIGGKEKIMLPISCSKNTVKKKTTKFQELLKELLCERRTVPTNNFLGFNT